VGTDPVRRPPPPFVPVAVVAVRHLSPRMVRVTFGGPGTGSLAPELPAASVRLLLPAGDGNVVVPDWDGNVFLLPDGSRAPIRTLTPLRVDRSGIDLEVVVHPGGRLSRWALAARPGAQAAISGPGRGYRVDPTASSYLLAGDETALPAIGQLLGHIPGTIPVEVLIETASSEARIQLPGHPSAEVSWLDLSPGSAPGSTLLAAVTATAVGADTRVWAAGEAAAMFRLRQHLFDGLHHPRANASVRGYWKAGRSGDTGPD
jgi:NADPH-dependent ferric siderophore reductase